MLKFISLLFIVSQANAQIDTLVLVKQSHVAYCNGKIKQMAILNHRMFSKDSAAEILLTRITDKDEQVKSLNIDADAYREQITILNSERSILTNQVSQQKTEIKQLRKKNFWETVGLAGLAAITLWVSVNN